MKVKDAIEKINTIEHLIDKLESSDLDYASDVVWELTCYLNIIRNTPLKEGLEK